MSTGSWAIINPALAIVSREIRGDSWKLLLGLCLMLERCCASQWQHDVLLATPWIPSMTRTSSMDGDIASIEPSTIYYLPDISYLPTDTGKTKLIRPSWVYRRSQPARREYRSMGTALCRIARARANTMTICSSTPRALLTGRLRALHFSAPPACARR
ncbi:hypothetical protein AOQ84DRAFT_104026 [Glonium stellatum]|uniref:Uncharacterized protein n=1 Tax=Glonium stellatum TaxID=574774 RepID=A0A8E2EUD9_9PEZI|nr:hypothetical protein AOQ84DRAFT_104026 [Glonium stellatum]